MGASLMEVSRLENLLQDLTNERTQLLSTVSNLNERNSSLESELKEVQSRELHLKEEAETIGAKIHALEECVSDRESKVSRRL
jgi:predicted  nucleic acid-binding Zn-ribbon protein